jgi:hypothetical protein
LGLFFLGKTTGRIKELLLCCKRSSRPLGVAVPPLVGGLLLYFMNPTHEVCGILFLPLSLVSFLLYFINPTPNGDSADHRVLSIDPSGQVGVYL